MTYVWGENAPKDAELPVDDTEYVPNQPYTVDEKYTSKTVVETEEGTWTFSGWDEGVVDNDGNVTITGSWEFTPTPTFTVTYDWGENAPEGKTLPTDATVYVSGREYNVDDTFTSDTVVETEEGTWTFSGWDQGVRGNDGNVTITGTWTFTPVPTFTVTWIDEDGTVLETDTGVKSGTTPTFDGTTPTKTADDKYTYTFEGWDKEISAVTADVTYTAKYKATEIVKEEPKPEEPKPQTQPTNTVTIVEEQVPLSSSPFKRTPNTADTFNAFANVMAMGIAMAGIVVTSKKRK